ncbi:hypothetical protein MWU54_10965 [Marivita sp. S6314]|uniref:hypothetical protein n=1 Tax=Marivita sp. S6314 TaxID=2926406 RepID=UPI001FF25885|nr:hypothetical protein [Marivita sp. S6314]MCK0150547.1 hypothetical protein [Marivita sp. S6314]
MKTSLILAFATLASSLAAEIVETTDGRRIELRADGTYVVLGEATASKIEMEEAEPFFEHHAGEYNQNSMRFMPIFKNNTGNTIVGFRFNTVFKSAFGDVVFEFAGESSERVPSGALSTANTFYFFDDNQFIPNQPYDKLKIFEGSSTGSITTEVTAVVFEDGTILKSE